MGDLILEKYYYAILPSYYRGVPLAFMFFFAFALRSLSRISVTGSQEPTPGNTRLTTREPQACLKLSGREKGLSGCVLKLIIVLGSKISLVVRVLIKNAMTLTKINI